MSLALAASPSPGGGMVLRLPSVPYPITPLLTDFLAVRLCRDRALWSRLGPWLDPGAMPDPAAKLLLTAAAELARELGHGPASTAIVLQRLYRWVDDGTHTTADLAAAEALILRVDERADRGEAVPPDDMLVSELTPMLQARARRQVLAEGGMLLAAGQGAALATFATRFSDIELIGAPVADLGDGWDDAEGAIASVQSTIISLTMSTSSSGESDVRES